MAKVLIVGEDKLFINLLSGWIKKSGHEVEKGGPSIRFWRPMVNVMSPDVIIWDIPVYEAHWDVIHWVINNTAKPKIILIAELFDRAKAALAIKKGVWDCLKKPKKEELNLLPRGVTGEFQEKIVFALACALEEKTISLENFNRNRIRGNGQGIKNCLAILSQAARTDEPILILGETGTGKELFAQAAHENSPRSGGNFVPFNCASVPEELAESILFGYKRGAHSTAYQDRDGLVRIADGGTLFLDEVGDLSLSNQAKLLRCLQERQVLPLGALAPEDTNFRLISATNKDIEEILKEKKLREDFYHRINAYQINLPPLRERIEDIKDIAQSIIDEFCKEKRLDPKSFTSEILYALETFEWPGNIRQLESVLKSSIVRSGTRASLNIYDLPREFRAQLIAKGYLNVAKTLMVFDS